MIWVRAIVCGRLFAVTDRHFIAVEEMHPSHPVRDAPHGGLSMLIRQIRSRESAPICGRPPRERDIHRQ